MEAGHIEVKREGECMQCRRRSPQRSSRQILFSFAVVVVFAAFAVPSRAVIIWDLAGGGSWNTAADWNPATVPNAVGAAAQFNGAATGSNPAQTANRSVTLDGAQTVGSIIF